MRARMRAQQQLLAACAGLLALALQSAAFWPFDDEDGPASDGPEIEVMQGQPMHVMPHFAFQGVPVVMVQSHSGFDPWEDLHSNVERLVENSARTPRLAGPRGGMEVAKPLEIKLGNLLDIFGGQHAGHFGRSEGSFQVDDGDESRFRLTALLPGYKLGGGNNVAESPLSVRAVGRRSLVVSGTQQSGPMIRTWQRSFALPKGSDIDQVAVTYNATDGNLTVNVPRHNVTDSEESGEEEGDFGGFGGFESGLPPALRVLRQGLPGVVNEISSVPIQRRGNMGGFLMPNQDMDLPDMLGKVLGMVSQMHPRYHPPPGGDREVPEDAVVNLVGCFAESQLAKVELKYYGEGNAASFNAMYWHARSDHVPYFAMARHEEPLGHAFTAHGFVHEDEKPAWGVYDGCGAPCADDNVRWCGCANEENRGFGSNHCPVVGEKRFAVYKIGEAPQPEEEKTENETDKNETRPAVTAQGRPYWQLNSATNGSGEPSIEIVVPKGLNAKANGHEVLLYNNTVPAKASADELRQSDAANLGHMASGSETDGMSGLAAADSASPKETATPGPSDTPVGKVKLPVGVMPEDCTFDKSRPSEDGGQVLSCRLSQGDVKSLPIKVLDEL